MMTLTDRMVACLALLAICFGASGTEGDRKASTGSFSRHTIEHDELEREYFVYLPSDYEDGADFPVVFFLHGYGGSATGTEAETTNGLNLYAEQYGYVMVYPQSTWFMSDVWTGEPWEVTSWNHVSGSLDEGPKGPLCAPDAVKFPCPPECGECGRCGWISCHDDLGFFDKLIVRVAGDFKTDRRRYYISGFSGGSLMAQYLACRRSDWFAAVALFGGRLERGFECGPTQPIALIQINGDRDKTVPADGRASSQGYFYASTKATAIAWNNGTSCEEEPQSWSSVLSEEQGLRCMASCAGTRRESIDCLWPGGEHYWGGYSIGHGSYGYCVTDLQRESMPDQTLCVEPDTTADVWGSRLMFEFFGAH
jgi:poly(3-hydroxybutyrate) depolymerase